MEARNRSVVRWIRLVGVLLVGVVVVMPVLFAVAWLSFAGARFGWIPCLAGFAAVGAAIGWLAVSVHWRSARSAAMVTLAVLAGLVGILAAHTAPATPGRLRHEIAGIEQPSWELRSDEVGGNAICFDTCTEVTRSYRLRERAEVVLAHLAELGLRAGPSFDDSQWMFARQVGGDIDVSVDVERRRDGGSDVIVTARASG